MYFIKINLNSCNNLLFPKSFFFIFINHLVLDIVKRGLRLNIFITKVKQFIFI